MVNSCIKCGKNCEKDKDITLFHVPIDGKDAEWQMEFFNQLGVEQSSDKDIYICNTHFAVEGLEMKNSVLHLKENALPLSNDEDFVVELDIKPEVVYYKNEGDNVDGPDSMSDTSETRDLVPLEPLVEYINVYENGQEDVELSPMNIESSEIQMTSENDVLQPEYAIEETGTQEIGVVTSQENNLEVEPVMPFFLTSSPMFTILNENNEETIILQIEQQDEKKQPAPVKEVIEDFEQSLCKSSNNTIFTTYTCDICDNSYGCLSCLKSHYETLHICNFLRRYKCLFSRHISKSLVCPVCELTFQTRNDTLDHYITHSVACEMCGSGFDRQAHLTEHYKTVHNKDFQISYECELCRMSYQYSSVLMKHYRTYHKMILCHICKARFTTVGALQDHEKMHQVKLKVLPYACSKCDQAFPKISDIGVHIRQYHKKESAAATELLMKATRPQKSKSEEDQVPVQKKVKVKK